MPERLERMMNCELGELSSVLHSPRAAARGGLWGRCLGVYVHLSTTLGHSLPINVTESSQRMSS